MTTEPVMPPAQLINQAVLAEKSGVPVDWKTVAFRLYGNCNQLATELEALRREESEDETEEPQS